MSARSILHVGHPEQQYPLEAGMSGVQVPFPETTDQLVMRGSPTGYPALRGYSCSEVGKLFDCTTLRVNTAILPEAKSASFLSMVLNEGNGAVIDRTGLSDAVRAHTVDILSGTWRYSNRCAALAASFIALLKLHEPSLAGGLQEPAIVSPLAAASNPGSTQNSVATIASIIATISRISQGMNQKLMTGSLGTLPPTGSFCMYYAATLLIRHGRGVLRDDEWLVKVESLRQTLCMMNQRWKNAGMSRLFFGTRNSFLGIRLTSTETDESASDKYLKLLDQSMQIALAPVSVMS